MKIIKLKELKAFVSKLILKKMALNYFKTDFKKKVLICYVLRPFVSNKSKLYKVHHNRRQAMNIALSFSELGYQVDVVSFDDPNTVNSLKTANYDVLFGRGPALTAAIKRYPSALAIYYATGLPMELHNINENKRVAEVNKKWGSNFKQARPLNIEDEKYANFDAIVALGNNNQVINYKKYFKGKLVNIDNVLYGYDLKKVDKNWSEHRKNFMYLVSKGKIISGMDLLFAVFDNHPDWNLHIITDFTGEEDFAMFFKKYLFEKPNIIFYGRHEVNTEKFNEIAQNCVAALAPICAAGQNGAVLSCMSYGLFPIISKDCNVDIDGGGFLLSEISTKAIESAIEKYLKISDDEISNICKNVQSECLRKYSIKRNKENIKNAFKEILQK